MTWATSFLSLCAFAILSELVEVSLRCSDSIVPLRTVPLNAFIFVVYLVDVFYTVNSVKLKSVDLSTIEFYVSPGRRVCWLVGRLFAQRRSNMLVYLRDGWAKGEGWGGEGRGGFETEFGLVLRLSM